MVVTQHFVLACGADSSLLFKTSSLGPAIMRCRKRKLAIGYTVFVMLIVHQAGRLKCRHNSSCYDMFYIIYLSVYLLSLHINFQNNLLRVKIYLLTSCSSASPLLIVIIVEMVFYSSCTTTLYIKAVLFL